MSLQFVFGASGSGKSSLLYQTIIEESIREPDRLFLVIVPEQFTLQTQRELVMRHPCHGILNIDVLSFQRLAYRVMEQTGTGGRRVLTETGKNLILRKVAGLVRDQLQVLGGRLDRQGMISLVKSMLSELSQYGVGEEQLSDMIELSEGRSHLKQKLSDLLVLMRSFDRYRQDRCQKQSFSHEWHPHRLFVQGFLVLQAFQRWCDRLNLYPSLSLHCFYLHRKEPAHSSLPAL